MCPQNWLQERTSENPPPPLFRKVILQAVIGLTLLLALSIAGTPMALASGSPPANSQNKSPISKGASLGVGATRTRPTASSSPTAGVTPYVYAPPPPGGSGIYDVEPIIFVGGIQNVTGYATNCSGYGGYWTNVLSYLQSNNQAVWHPGIGEPVAQTGNLYTVGYYNNNTQCSAYLSTTYSGGQPAPNCNGLVTEDGQTIANNNPAVGTTGEPIEHIACELSWYVYYNFSSYGTDIKIAAHSMGGLIARYMIQKTGHDSHFAPYVDVSDVVTFSTPHGGLSYGQTTGEDYYCLGCYQAIEMEYDSAHVETAFMQAIYSNSHPNAANGTDWTMIGSLASADQLDWDYQATTMSNSGGLSNNHRIGYSAVPDCAGQPSHTGWYGHGDYLKDPCDGFDASYYYCDACSETQHSGFDFANKDAPHSIHEMLFAFTYAGW